jgi:hypothetical protein
MCLCATLNSLWLPLCALRTRYPRLQWWAFPTTEGDLPGNPMHIRAHALTICDGVVAAGDLQSEEVSTASFLLSKQLSVGNTSSSDARRQRGLRSQRPWMLVGPTHA